MLALKVVLSAGSTVPTLVFDEVDSGVGGATAASVGERLARVAEAVQVLVVTHSPQACSAWRCALVSKAAKGGRTATTVEPLTKRDRREEIARMLAGEKACRGGGGRRPRTFLGWPTELYDGSGSSNQGKGTRTSGLSRWGSPAPIRYPDPDIVALDPRFNSLYWATRRSNGSPPDFVSPKWAGVVWRWAISAV